MLEISKREINDLKSLQEDSTKTLEKIIDDSSKREKNLVEQIRFLNEKNTKNEGEFIKTSSELLKIQIESQCFRSKYSIALEENEKLKEVLKESEAKRKDLQNLLSNSHAK